MEKGDKHKESKKAVKQFSEHSEVAPRVENTVLVVFASRSHATTFFDIHVRDLDRSGDEKKTEGRDRNR